MNALFAEIKLAWLWAKRSPILGLMLLVPCSLLVVPEPLLPSFLPLLWFVILLVGIWLSAAGFAYDRQVKRLPLTLTKPTPFLLLWTGRWIGRSLPQIIAILFTGCLLFVRFPIQPGRNVTHPTLPDLETLTTLEIARLQALHRIPTSIPTAQVREAVRHDLLTRTLSLERHEPQTYQFAPSTSTGLQLRLSGYPFIGEFEKLQLTVTPDQSMPLTPQLSKAGFTLSLPDQTHQITLSRRDENIATGVIFQPRIDLVLLSDGISPYLNLLAFLVIFLLTCLIANAISLTFSTYLSLPVTFISTSLLFIALLAATLMPRGSAVDSNATLTAKIGTYTSRALEKPFQSLLEARPIDALLTGEHIHVFPVLFSLIPLLIPCILLALIHPSKE